MGEGAGMTTLLQFKGTRAFVEAASTGHRQHTALVIQTGGKRVLVDLGKSWASGIPKEGDVEAGRGPLAQWDPQFIFVTHAHEDHAGGLKGVDPGIPVYMTKETSELLPEKDFPISERVIIEGAFRFGEDGPEAEAFPVKHSRKTPTVALRILTEDGPVGVATDILGFNNATDRGRFLGGLKVYVGGAFSLERDRPGTGREPANGPRTGYASVATQSTWLREAEVPSSIWTHFGTEAIGLGEKTLAARLRDLGPEVAHIVAKDGIEIPIRSQKPVLLEKEETHTHPDHVGTPEIVQEDVNPPTIQEVAQFIRNFGSGCKCRENGPDGFHGHNGAHDHEGLPFGGEHFHDADNPDGLHRHRPDDPLEGAHSRDGDGSHEHPIAKQRLMEQGQSDPKEDGSCPSIYPVKIDVNGKPRCFSRSAAAEFRRRQSRESAESQSQNSQTKEACPEEIKSENGKTYWCEGVAQYVTGSAFVEGWSGMTRHQKLAAWMMGMDAFCRVRPFDGDRKEAASWFESRGMIHAAHAMMELPIQNTPEIKRRETQEA